MTNPDLLAAFGERYVRGYAEDGWTWRHFSNFRGWAGIAQRNSTQPIFNSPSEEFVPLRETQIRTETF